VRHEKGKNRRRKRIIDEATTLLASNDQSLSLRTLAAASEVTVPTIYNLIGNKTDVMLAVCREIVVKHQAKIDSYNGADPLELLREMINWSARSKKKNARLFRATYLAWDELMRSRHPADEMARVMQRAIRSYAMVVHHAQEQGQLEGRIPAELLAAQIYQGDHDAALLWANRRISVAEYKRRSLLALYLALLADASEPLRTRLADEINACHVPSDAEPAVAESE